MADNLDSELLEDMTDDELKAELARRGAALDPDAATKKSDESPGFFDDFKRETVAESVNLMRQEGRRMNELVNKGADESVKLLPAGVPDDKKRLVRDQIRAGLERIDDPKILAQVVENQLGDAVKQVVGGLALQGDFAPQRSFVSPVNGGGADYGPTYGSQQREFEQSLGVKLHPRHPVNEIFKRHE